MIHRDPLLAKRAHNLAYVLQVTDLVCDHLIAWYRHGTGERAFLKGDAYYYAITLEQIYRDQQEGKDIDPRKTLLGLMQPHL